MAWTTQKTWVTNELVTAADLNTYIRDNGNYLFAGVRHVYVDALGMRPTGSNGCAPIATQETTAGRPDINYLAFDDASQEYAQFKLAMPRAWNLGTITALFHWTSTAMDADTVTWSLQGVHVPDGSTIDVAYGTAVSVADTLQSVAELELITAESAAITIAGAIADDGMTRFRVSRETGGATEDGWLIGVTIKYTVDKAFEL